MNKIIRIKIKCPVCKKRIRVPINKGKVLVTCPHCVNRFYFGLNIKKQLKKLKNNFFVKGIYIYVLIVLFLIGTVLFINKCKSADTINENTSAYELDFKI